MKRKPQLILALAILLLAGCAGPATRVPGDVSWADHSAELQQLTSWTIEGKLALRTAEQAESATMRWLQQGASTHLSLSGPMGINATTIHSDGRLLEIQQGDQTSRWDLADPALLASETGWDLPLQALPYWLKGIASPELPIQAQALNPEQTLLQSLQQDNWLVTYEDYATFGNYRMPTRLRIQRASTSVRVIIRDWQLPPG
jgi:outer membrane lipoprotein LolB